MIAAIIFLIFVPLASLNLCETGYEGPQASVKQTGSLTILENKDSASQTFSEEVLEKIAQ